VAFWRHRGWPRPNACSRPGGRLVRFEVYRARTIGTSAPASRFFPWIEMDKSAKDHRSMRHAQLVSIFSRGWVTGRVAFVSVAVLALLATPARSPAQDAGASGIPLGPANARGPNGSVNDPSGIGNAARVPAIPPPAISPVPVPTVSPPAAYRTFPVQRAVKMRRTRFAASGSRRAAARAAVSEQDRLLDRKITGICKGC
jgi:hypothetical protein